MVGENGTVSFGWGGIWRFGSALAESVPFSAARIIIPSAAGLSRETRPAWRSANENILEKA